MESGWNALEFMRLPIQTKQCQKLHFVLSLSFFFSQANSTLSYLPFGTGLHVNLLYFLACSAVIFGTGLHVNLLYFLACNAVISQLVTPVVYLEFVRMLIK